MTSSLYSYEVDFIHGLLPQGKVMKIAQSFNSIIRYLDDVDTLNNARIWLIDSLIFAY
jgi:hypothetical protein